MKRAGMALNQSARIVPSPGSRGFRLLQIGFALGWRQVPFWDSPSINPCGNPLPANPDCPARRSAILYWATAEEAIWSRSKNALPGSMCIAEAYITVLIGNDDYTAAKTVVNSGASSAI